MAANKKILQISTVHQPNDPRIVHRISTCLSKNYKIYLAIGGGRKEQYPELSITPLVLPKNFLNRFVIAPLQVLWLAIKLKPKVVHFHDPELILICFLMHIFKVKVVMDIHESPVGQFKYSRNALKRGIWPFYNYLLKKIANKFYFVLAEKSYLKEFEYVDKKRIIVIQNYPDLNRFTPFRIKEKNQKKLPPCLFYIGLIAIDREIHTLFEALYLLQRKGEIIQLILIGMRKESEKCIASYPDFEKIKNQIRLLPLLPHSVAYPLAQDCFAGIALLKPTENYIGSYPTKLFEYMAIGLPVITTKLPLCDSIIQNYQCGISVEYENAQALSDAILWLLNNPKEGKKMGENGIIATQNEFNWEKECEKLQNWYQELL